MDAEGCQRGNPEMAACLAAALRRDGVRGRTGLACADEMGLRAAHWEFYGERGHGVERMTEKGQA